MRIEAKRSVPPAEARLRCRERARTPQRRAACGPVSESARIRRDRRSAFTLMEVLVVVAILVVLAGVGGFIYLRIQEDQYRNSAKLQVESLEKMARAYEQSHEDFPTSLQELVQPPDGGRGYVELKDLVDPWGRPYQYAYPPQQPPNQMKGVPDVWSQGPDPNNPQGVIGNWQ